MSYILDALKKAESERNLGSVPNVHAQAPNASENADDAHWSKLLPWSLAALALGILLLALAWLQPWRQQTPVTPIASAPVAVPAVAPAVAPAAVAEPAPANAQPITSAVTATPAVTAPPVMTESPVAPHPPVAQVKPEPAPPVSKPMPQPVAKSLPTVTVADKPATTSASPQAETPAKAAPDDKEVGTAKELPQYIQSQLPAVAVNGYIYARDPADRSVLMNQRLLHEGDSITPELTLEKLLPKGAILNFKGYRYRIAF